MNPFCYFRVDGWIDNISMDARARVSRLLEAVHNANVSATRDSALKNMSLCGTYPDGQRRSR